MAADASIFNQYLKPVRSVADYAGDMDAREANQLEMAAKRQAAADDNAVRQAYAQSGGDTNKIRALLQQGGSYKALNSYDAAQLASEKTRGDMAESKARAGKLGVDTDAANYKLRMEKSDQAIRDISSFGNLDAVHASLDQKERSGEVTPQQAQMIRQGLPTTEADLPRWQVDMLRKTLTAKDQMAQLSPDANARLSTQTTQRGQDISAETARAGREQSERHFGVTSGQKDREIAMGGKPPPGYRWSGSDLVAIPGGPGDKLPESQQKQVVGVNNLSDAIGEYRAQLKDFGKASVLSPDDRAGMGTKYNNMMLQAKEAYNLGVLNGPDLEILTSVITDPRSMRGIITSNKALDAQASELDRIMQKIGTVSGRARQPQNTPGASPAKTKAGATASNW